MNFKSTLAQLASLCLLLNISFAQNTPIKIGDEYNVNVETKHPYKSAGTNGGYVFEEQFQNHGSSYIKIHFKDFQLAPEDYVIITSPNSEQEIIYAGGGKWIEDGTRTISDFWSMSLMDDTAIVRLYSAGGNTDHGFTIDKVAYGYPEDVIQQSIYRSICGNDDKENIECYNGTTMFDRAEAICRVVIGGSGLCTGWLLGTEGHVMTNNHCVSSQTSASNTEFQFNYKYGSCAGTGGTTVDIVAQSSTLICTNSSLDYTLLKLPVNPTNTYGFLSLRSTGPAVGERIYIPQHPGGSPKKISVNDDQSPTGFARIVNTTGGSGTRVEYYSDTEGGSSGSAVLGYGDHLVVALHNTGGCTNGGNRSDAIINSMGSCLPLGAVDNTGDLLISAFSTDVIKSCDGVVNFTNQSVNDNSRIWNFGDGNSSTVDNPTHTYTSSGTYTVSLIVQDGNGNSETSTQDIIVSLIPAPLANDTSICTDASVTLAATGSGGIVGWYDAASGGSLLQVGANYTTPVLNVTTTYYIEETENTTVQNVGPFDNSIGAGQSFTSNDSWGLYFDVDKPMTLKSVKVIAGAAGNRTIQVLDGATVLHSTTVNIPAGTSRVNLNFDIDPGEQYLIKVTGSLVDLYRNSAAASWPYTVSGLMSITGNNTTSGNADNYYYYFYDWEVQEVPCTSPRSAVTVTYDGGNCCNAPASLLADQIGTSNARLNWSAVGTATKYQLKGKKTSGSAYVFLDINNPSQTNKVVFGLDPDTDYEWQVRARCEENGVVTITDWSSLDTFRTLCSTPANHVANNITSNSVRLNWDVVPGAQGYLISGRKVGGVYVDLLVADGTKSFKNVGGLDPNTSYEWKIRALCDTAQGTNSPYSILDYFTTASATRTSNFGSGEFKVFPNPFTGSTTIQLPGIDEIWDLQLLDLSGRVLINRNDVTGPLFELQVGSLPKGVYVLRVNGVDQFVERVVIK